MGVTQVTEVKFFNAVKYDGIKYPAHKPFYVRDSDVEALVAKGAIVTTPPAVKLEPEEIIEETKSVEDMTVAELKAYAAENEIDISKAERKAEILATIKRA